MTAQDPRSRRGRRAFLAQWNAFALAGLAVSPIAIGKVGFEMPLQPPQEKRAGFPAPPAPADPDAQDKDAHPGIDPQTAKRVMAAKNEKEFREGVEKLFQMATELRDELAQAPKMNVLSVRMYKKTEEIEKLAKQLKSKAKGG
jgi:hypothetical protein